MILTSENNSIPSVSSNENALLNRYFIDHLTNLPNIYQLRKDLEDKEVFALIIFNVDNFRTINNFYGCMVGDYVIEDLGEHFKSNFKNHKTYRLSGDEFAFVIDKKMFFYDIKEHLSKFCEDMKDFVVKYLDTNIYIDFTLASSASKNNNNIFSKVSMALKHAKETNSNFWIYEDTMNFEKMLYDNALLCELYTNTYLTYKDEDFLKTAKDIADFWQNFMSEDNLFYSASDADSEGAEGTYFTYSYDEVYSTLSKHGYENVEEMLAEMEVTKDGNFEGKNIIRFDNGIVPEYFENVKILLQDLRKNRAYPFIDRKIQTSWSSMMIKALFTLGAVDFKYKEKAIKSLDALLSTMFIDSMLYHTTLIHKTPKIEAFLEDYAFLSQALISAYNSTQDEIYLIQAQKFTNLALEKFYNKGYWNFSVGEFETKADIADNTYTSPVSIMVDVLISLGTLLEDEKYSHFAFKTLEYNSYELGRRPVIYPYMLRQTLRHLKGDRVIKSNAENLDANAYELSSLSYPFTHKKLSQDAEFIVCSDKSCYANTDNINKINDIIKNSF